MKFLDVNYSFASSYGDSERFKVIFSDSEVAKNYHWGARKIKYDIHFGTAWYVRKSLLYDVANVSFSFKLDETTISKIQKKYDAYARKLV